MAFENIAKPGKVGKLTIKNRTKYASTVTNFCDPKEGLVTEREIGYLVERARGGFGMVTTGGAYPHILGKGYPGQMSCADDKDIPGMTKLASAIKGAGAVVVGQIMHTGRYAHPGEYISHDVQPVGPSVVPPRIPRYQTVRELSISEIEELVELHGKAATRFKKAGFDIVEVCGIVGYLISNFLCQYTNKRTDKYGGSVENRVRFFVEIVDRVRKGIGPDMPLAIRLNSTDFMEGGNPDEEYVQMGKILEGHGVDLISLSIGWHESVRPCITNEIPTGGWLGNAAKFKAAVKVPIAMAYRLNKPEPVEEAIKEGKLDYWEMCRTGIADAAIPNKVISGHPEDIAICMACNLGCFNRVFMDVSMACTINARVGREWDPAFQIKPAETKKKVIVVGGGPAGMEAARIAAMRGHNVTLYEKENQLGGQLNLLGKTPNSSEWIDDVKYLETQLKKLGVKVELDKEVTAGFVVKERPDAVVVATGATPSIPHVPGIDKKHVVTCTDILAGKAPVGQKVVVWGGKEIGVQTAEWIAKQGKEVTIVEEFKRIGKDVNAFNIWGHRSLLANLKVKLLLETTVERITDGGIVVKKDGQEQTIPADTVVLASSMEARKELLQALETEAAIDDVRSAGDCVAPRKAFNAIHDGHKAGLEV
ncbi:MAG: FAD-dependent oxidoreductase [Dehalococcoidia bacterium]|nr:FAD-dependent oxidoreductase [Dehalococcoidia bacterium]